MIRRWRLVLTHAIALGIGLVPAWSVPIYEKRDSKELKRGYAVPFTVDGKKYTFSFRARPSLYSSWCTPIWIVEGWEPTEAERLMELTDDMLLGIDGSLSGRIEVVHNKDADYFDKEK